jgi:hypothetical protein
MAWALGVLCTTDAGGRRQLLREVRRAVRPGAPLGLLVLLATHAGPIDGPEGNDHPTRDELDDVLAASGFAVGASVDAATLADAPAGWQAAADAVDGAMRAEHGHEPAWQTAQRQEQRIGELLAAGDIVTLLVLATAR